MDSYKLSHLWSESKCNHHIARCSNVPPRGVILIKRSRRPRRECRGNRYRILRRREIDLEFNGSDLLGRTSGDHTF